jgi:hypothetical protein
MSLDVKRGRSYALPDAGSHAARVRRALRFYCVESRAANTSFQFHVPEGWVSLGGSEQRDKIEAARAAGVITDELAKQAQSTEHEASAINPIAGTNFAENMTATVKDGAAPITQEVLDGLVRDLRGNGPGLVNPNLTVETPEVVTIQGVACGKLVADVPVKGTVLRTVMYLLPSKSQMAQVTFSAPRDVFEQHRGLYEATVAKTVKVRPGYSRAGRRRFRRTC